MENWAEIRRRVLADGLSGGAACREYQVHWKALQEILDHSELPGYRRTRPKRPSILEPLLPAVHQALEDDRKAPKKQRHAGQRIFDRLRAEHGYRGGLTTVKDAVRAWRRRTAEAFVPRAHPPAQAQADFGQAEVALDGRAATVAVLVMTRPYSDAAFTCAFPRECTEASLEGHARAFESFGGAPRRISYDNPRIAAARITGTRDRKLTAESLRPRSHHLLEGHFCPVRRPNEKGHVETLVGFARRNSLVPVPAVHGGLEPLNSRLEADRRVDLSRRPRGKPATRAESLSEDRSAMPPLPPEAFLAARVERPTADSLSPVRFATNDYSVPAAYAHHRPTAIGTVDMLRVVAGQSVVAGHRRCRDRDRVFYDPVPYPALLGREPGARDFAAPLEGWELPAGFGVLGRRLEAEFGGPGARRPLKGLRLLEWAGPRDLTRAVERAPGPGVADAGAVRLILEHGRERPAGVSCLDGRPHLKLVGVPAPTSRPPRA